MSEAVPGARPHPEPTSNHRPHKAALLLTATAVTRPPVITTPALHQADPATTLREQGDE
ncbi:hypothetical protein [Streptomyces sp. S.PNR 29]|uniref:hypothetical protein n=1 Tax=Streptomyces sp. S.PNR 29 TaxID=2973805 RepID=UPI0025B10EF9|nr:hypothetical protein [Streptomyces sp. S.PNR 29]MDN0196898.1 hypothetical protein [Streptomyces sp. S.PNR 29]